MTRQVWFGLVAMLSPLYAFAVTPGARFTCPTTEQAVLAVEHQLWSAGRGRGVSTLDRLIDDSYLDTNDEGVRTGKREIIDELNKPEGNEHNETDETPADIRLVFTNGVAILNFSKHWTIYNKRAGASWGATSVMTRVFACKKGEWKMVARHETNLANRNRTPAANPIALLDDYVGHYRLSENAEAEEISVVRTGDKLFETWPGDKATEILPGKYDTFFSRDEELVERFVRDQSGKVMAILYTAVDGELEAKRMP
jgi:Domain of unknown function (DUF4440)